MDKENIILFLKTLGAKRIKIRNNWIMCSCIFSADHPKGTDNKPSFGISISNPSYYHCFTCNKKGLLYEIQPLLRYYNLDKNGSAYEIIRNKESFDFKLIEQEVPKVTGIVPYYQYEKYPRPKKSYLNIPVELYERWDIREDSEYVFIPIFDRFSRLVEVKIRRKDGGNICGSKCCLASDNFYPDLQRINGSSAKSSGIWFGSNLINQELNYLILVEGERDAILLSQFFDNVIASMGATITKPQLSFLSQFDFKFILFFDNDRAGKEATSKVIKGLPYKKLYYVSEYFGFKDPAEVIENKYLEEVVKSIKKC